jgi:hypothetical protein
MVLSFKVLKKCSASDKITLYLDKWDFIDYIGSIEPIGKYYIYKNNWSFKLKKSTPKQWVILCTKHNMWNLNPQILLDI